MLDLGRLKDFGTVTSHPDFDDTPLWDENNNSNYADDGIIFHSHWVVLVKDDRVPGSLSVKQFNKTDKLLCFHQSRYANVFGFSPCFAKR